MTDIQVWADSFHEGDWACEQLGLLVESQGGTRSVNYLNGFQPVHSLELNGGPLKLTVFGSYRAWFPLPTPIEELLIWGKPDFIFYDVGEGRILFAVEETAATPTGNQALQRCERQYGASRAGVPFWYLLSEFGIHRDGGIRRDSVWPTVMALKLSQDRSVPSVVLHYSDLEHPEDYSAGSGLNSLFSALLAILENFQAGRPLFDHLDARLKGQFQSMLTFLSSQWRQQMDFLPGEADIDEYLAEKLAAASVGDRKATSVVWSKAFLRWPTAGDLPKPVKQLQIARPLLKYDALGEQAETDLAEGRAYGFSATNTGSKPQRAEKVAQWIGEQRRLFASADPLDPAATFDLDQHDFPSSTTGLLHVTTGKRITYLYDKWSSLRQSIEKAYPRVTNRLPDFPKDQPALLYISNSIKPGRIFGDPFTGQIAAFAVIFGRLDPRPRLVVAHFPHQVHKQALTQVRRPRNKGLTVMAELTDLILFHGGVGVVLSEDLVI